MSKKLHIYHRANEVSGFFPVLAADAFISDSTGMLWLSAGLTHCPSVNPHGAGTFISPTKADSDWSMRVFHFLRSESETSVSSDARLQTAASTMAEEPNKLVGFVSHSSLSMSFSIPGFW